MQEQKLRLGDIVIDQLYQPRTKINSHKINEYAGKMQEGVIFPPIVVDKETNKLISGFTRIEAYRKLHEPNFKVYVLLKNFKDESEKLFFTYDDNQHGEPLSKFDVRNLVFKLKSMGVPDTFIMKRLKLNSGFITCTPTADVITATVGAPREYKKLPKQKKRKEKVIVESKSTIQKKVLKGSLNHLIGTELSSEVYDNIANHYSGMPIAFHAGQIIMRIDDGTVNKENKKEIFKLEELYKKLGEFFV